MIEIDRAQVARVAELLKQMPEGGRGLNFYSFFAGDKEIVATDMYPELNHPRAIEFFFFVCLHQFGFWFGDTKGYVKPLFGMINGKECKGSDLLWKVCKRALDKNPEVFNPESLANISPEKLMFEIFCDDRGPIPFPDIEERFAITRGYGQSFGWSAFASPHDIIEKSNIGTDVLKSFITFTRFLCGFYKDDFRKKNLLLAMALANRPEKFLQVPEDEKWPPIIDYHLMRIALRMGMVKFLLTGDMEENIRRKWVDYIQEERIRHAVFDAIQETIKQSGKPMSFIDLKFWMARKFCPEMSEPACEKCLFKDVCEKKTDFFQPIFRTTNY